MSRENTPATIRLRSTGEFALFGAWTARGIDRQLLNDQTISAPTPGPMVLDAARIDALDSVSARVLQKMLQRWREGGAGGEASSLARRPESAFLTDPELQNDFLSAGKGSTLGVGWPRNFSTSRSSASDS